MLLQASVSRPAQAVRAPAFATKPANVLSTRRTNNASLSTFYTGVPLRLGASGSLRNTFARQRLSVSSAAATEVHEETHEYQAEVQYCFQLASFAALRPATQQHTTLLMELSLHLMLHSKVSMCMPLHILLYPAIPCHQSCGCTRPICTHAGEQADGHDRQQPVQQPRGVH